MAASAARPNVLLIVTDQQRADHLGCYGNRILRTPNIDALAAAGWAADRFYVSSPICMPNRATLMTGRVPSVHGVRHNGIPLALDSTTFPELLRANGYRTALIGKSHLQNMTGRPSLSTPPWPHEAHARESSSDAYEQENPNRWRDPAHHMTLPFYGFDHVRLCIDHGDLVEGDYGRWLRERLPDADQRRGSAGAAPSDVRAPQAWRTRIPAELYPTAYIAGETIGYLERHAAGDAPFFLQCSFPDPHHPFTPPGEYWPMYAPDDIPLPPSFDTPDDRVPPHVATLRAERDYGIAVTGSQAVFACSARDVREATALTYGMIAMIDDAVGRIVATLKRLGLDRTTIVAFTSDHGDFMGDHQLMLKGPLHFQGLIRVPFIWFDPQAPAGGSRSDDLLGTIDIAPTVLDRTGTEMFNGIQGRSLLSSIAGSASTPRDAFLVEEEAQRVQMGFSERARLRTVVTRDHRLSVYANVPWGELYDLRNDPHEMVNLWDDPASSGVRGELSALLSRTMIAAAETSPHPTALA